MSTELLHITEIETTAQHDQVVYQLECDGWMVRHKEFASTLLIHADGGRVTVLRPSDEATRKAVQLSQEELRRRSLYRVYDKSIPHRRQFTYADGTS